MKKKMMTLLMVGASVSVFAQAQTTQTPAAPATQAPATQNAPQQKSGQVIISNINATGLDSLADQGLDIYRKQIKAPGYVAVCNVKEGYRWARFTSDYPKDKIVVAHDAVGAVLAKLNWGQQVDVKNLPAGIDLIQAEDGTPIAVIAFVNQNGTLDGSAASQFASSITKTSK